MAIAYEEKYNLADYSFPPLTSLYGDVFTSTINRKMPLGFYGGYIGQINVTANKTITEEYMQLLVNVTRQATGITITLPDATTNKGQVITIVVAGAGVGNVSLAGSVGQLLNGINIASWVWSGEGSLSIVSDGNNYCVLSTGVYDSKYSTDSFIKFANGSLIQTKVFTGIAVNNALGTGFESATQVWTYGIISTVVPTVIVQGQDLCWGVLLSAPTTGITQFRLKEFVSRTNVSCQLHLTGRWY